MWKKFNVSLCSHTWHVNNVINLCHSKEEKWTYLRVQTAKELNKIPAFQFKDYLTDLLWTKFWFKADRKYATPWEKFSAFFVL